MALDQPKSIWPEKFPPLTKLSFDQARDLLRMDKRDKGLGLAGVMRLTGCDAHAADDILREMAEVGYLAPAVSSGERFTWGKTQAGNRLAHEKKLKRIPRIKVDAIILELVERAKAINADPDRLQRVRLRLFGSCLEEREDYGDVDVAIELCDRDLSAEDKARISANLEARLSVTDQRHILASIIGAKRQDSKEISAVLKKGLPHLSLTADDPVELGSPFRWLVDHDIATDCPIEVSSAIVLPAEKMPSEQPEQFPLPAVTLIKARFRVPAPEKKMSITGLHIGFEDAADLEAAMWTPKVTSSGDLVANDLSRDPRMRFAGFQHLCDAWKEPIGGLKMLRHVLSWCHAHEVGLRYYCEEVSISTGHRCSVIRFGFGNDLIYFRIGPNGPIGSLFLPRRTRASKLDLAGVYGMAFALNLVFQEAQCSKLAPCSIEFPLGAFESYCLPDFPKLFKKGVPTPESYPGLCWSFLADTREAEED